MLNTNGIQADFVQYLRENGLLEAADANKQVGLINIENYSSEMADFLQTQYGLESDLVSVEIGDVNDLQFDRAGNLVNDNEFDIDEVRNMDMNDAQNQKGVLAGFLGILVNTGNTRMQIDADGDGNLTQAEMDAFIETVSSKDGDTSTLSLNDILGSMDQISNNTFRIGDLTAAGNDFAARTPTAPAVTQPPAVDYTKLTNPELETKLSEQETAKANAQTQLNAVNAEPCEAVEPKSSAVDAAKQSFDAIFANSDNAVKKSIADQAAAISTQEGELTDLNEQINQSEITQSELQTSIDTFSTDISNIDGKIASAEGQKKTLPASTDPNYNAIKAQNAGIDKTISLLKSEQDTLKTQKTELENILKQEQEKHAELTGQYARKETELNNAKAALDAYTKEHSDIMNEPGVQEAYDNFMNTQSAHHANKRAAQDNLTASIKTHEGEISKATQEIQKRSYEDQESWKSYTFEGGVNKDNDGNITGHTPRRLKKS